MIQCVAKHLYLNNSVDDCYQEFPDYSSLTEHLYREHRAVLIGLVIAADEIYQVVGRND